MSNDTYRFPPYTIETESRKITVHEDKCMCTCCDTIWVKVEDHVGNVEIYNIENEDPKTQPLKDPYDRIDELKRVILEMAKVIKELKNE